MPDNAAAHRGQVTAALRDRYFSIVPPREPYATEEQRQKDQLSRSLAALALEKLADLAPAEAANCIIDGFDDNGLDAIYFDRPQNYLWVVQSKIGNAPDQGEVKKFCDGIRDLVGGRFDKFNAMFQRLLPEVEDALATDDLKVMGCAVYLSGELGTHARNDLEQLKGELNQFVERFDWRDLSLAVVHGWLTAEQSATPIKIELTLERWHGIDAPHRAFYGLVSADALVDQYEAHGKAMFERNIRHFLGALSVNQAIATTARENPGELLYLNNGLTAVCSSITPKPNITNESGVFVLDGFSIVNGAQTLGSLEMAKRSAGALSADAKLFLTLIEVGPPPDTLGPQVTRARNTQNAVRSLHFAALDPQHERLRQELALAGVTYLYRPSEGAAEGGPEAITVEEAAIALAALSGVTRTAVAAKRERGQLYEQDGEFYSTLFREGIPGVAVQRSVAIYQHLDRILTASEQAEASFSRRKMFYRHSRLFVMHILSRRHRTIIERPQGELSEEDKNGLSRAVTELAELIYGIAETKFGQSKGYLSLFRNLTDAQPLADDVITLLNEQDQAAAAPGSEPASP